MYFILTEGQIPKGAIYVGSQKSQEGGVETTDMYYMAPAPMETVVEKRTKEVCFFMTFIAVLYLGPAYKGIENICFWYSQLGLFVHFLPLYCLNSMTVIDDVNNEKQ